MALTNGGMLVTVAGLRGVYDEIGEKITKLENKVSIIYKPCGSIAFADLPTPSADTLGNIYNVTDEFTTTDSFVEGEGTKCSAGTNVGIILVQTTNEETGTTTKKYKYDLFSIGGSGGGSDDYVTQKQFTTAMSDMTNYVRDVEFPSDDSNTITVTKGNGSSSTYTINVGKNADVITDITIDTSLTTDLGRTTNRRIVKNSDTGQVQLWWSDPKDDGKSDTWGETLIIKKKGSFPTSIEDGTLVVICAVRDRFKNNAYVDTQESPDEWNYCAFPVATTGAISSTATANKFEFWHYAICIDESNAVPSTCVSYVEGYDNEGYTPLIVEMGADNSQIKENKCNWGDWADAPFMPRPCMLKSDGTVDYYLNPNDYTLKENGEPSDVADTSYDGNAMMEFNKVFIRARRVSNKLYIYFCSDKYDNNYECWPCKKEDGTYADHYYMSIYQATLVDGKLRSISTGGSPSGTLGGMTSAASYAVANGVGWNINLWSDWETFTLLSVLVTRRLDVLNSTTRYTTSAPLGSSNKKGMFWGSYNGQSTYNGKAFGIEMPWGQNYRYCHGIYLSGSYNRDIFVKRTYSTIDGSTTLGYNQSGTGYVKTGLQLPQISSYSHVKQIQGDNRCITAPLSALGSSTTYYCADIWGYTNNKTYQYRNAIFLYANSPFAWVAGDDPSDSAFYYGASLSYKGF